MNPRRWHHAETDNPVRLLCLHHPAKHTVNKYAMVIIVVNLARGDQNANISHNAHNQYIRYTFLRRGMSGHSPQQLMTLRNFSHI